MYDVKEVFDHFDDIGIVRIEITIQRHRVENPDLGELIERKHDQRSDQQTLVGSALSIRVQRGMEPVCHTGKRGINPLAKNLQ